MLGVHISMQYLRHLFGWYVINKVNYFVPKWYIFMDTNISMIKFNIKKYNVITLSSLRCSWMTLYHGAINTLRLRHKMAAIFQMTVSNRFSSTKMYELKFHWNLFLGVQQCGKLNLGGTHPKRDIPYMFYTKFHFAWPIFYSPSLKGTHIGEQASVSFPHWSN